MKRNNPFRLRLDFDGPWLTAAAALMGGALFLRAVYYFGIQGLSDGLGTLLFMMAFPMALEAAMIIFLRGTRLNAPGLCGLMAAAYCLLLVAQCFLYGNFLRCVVGIAAYLVCGTMILALIFEIRSRELVFAVFAVVAAARFVLFGLGALLRFRIGAFLPEAAALCGLIAMAILPFGMKKIARRSRD